MSDFRNSDYRNPNDPFQADTNLDPNARGPNQAWGWVAAAVFVVVVLAIAFGFGHKPGQLGTNTAANDVSPPAVTHMSPPTSTVLPPSTAPGTPTPSTAPPPAATPNTPAVPGAH